MRAGNGWVRRCLEISLGGTLASATLLVALIGLVDYATGYRLRISVFYLVPLLWLTWRIGRAAGMLFALLAAGIWLAADLASRDGASPTILPYWNALVTLGFFAVSVIILSALKDERSTARTCPLTGLPNRLAFFEIAGEELERARRYGRPISVVYIDLDHFKAVNDRFGHAAGDALLRTVGRVLQDHLRQTDCVARLGGDEFVILLPEAATDAAVAAAHKLARLLEEALRMHPGRVTTSIGVATFLRLPPSVDDLVRAADDEMYGVKKAGKNAVRSTVLGSPRSRGSPEGASRSETPHDAAGERPARTPDADP